jgi:DNA mismatch repair protein MutH
VKPPESRKALLVRARRFAGWTLGELADRYGWDVPVDLRRHKGWTGRLLEEALGSSAEPNAKKPDFEEIGVELKTIPVDGQGRPRESTFVCSVPLAEPDEVDWEESGARQKLLAVLFVPILAEPERSVDQRLVGTAILWTPSEEEEQVLATDWRGHMEVIRAGLVEEICAREGVALQVRPKGATARSRTWGVDDRGEAILTQPRAFYLRASFTGEILARHFLQG